MAENTKVIYDPNNPDRGLCCIDGCKNLQHNHGNNRWGRFCCNHHREPLAREQRKATRNQHREMLKAEIAARGIERRRNLKALEIYPRLCTKCGQQRSVVEWGGRRTVCKPCTAKRVRERTLKKKYNIDTVEYKMMVLSQNGVCAICGLPPNNKGLVVDHCHDTDNLRGLLCGKCNTGLGQFNDDLDLLASASSYIINSRLKVVC